MKTTSCRSQCFSFGKVLLSIVFIFKSIYFHLGDVIKSSKELIEHCNQLFGRTGACQLSESHYICIQDTTHTKWTPALKSPITYKSKLEVNHNRTDVTTVTWRLCADGCKDCENCESCSPSSRCTRAWRVFLSLPFSAPQRCSVATLTREAAPVTMGAESTQSGWPEVEVGRLITLFYRGDDLHTEAGRYMTWATAWRHFEAMPCLHTRSCFIYLFTSCGHGCVWDCLFSFSLALDKWMINLLSQKHTVTQRRLSRKKSP